MSKFRFLIVNMEDTCVEGTDDTAVIERLDGDDWVVIDTQANTYCENNGDNAEIMPFDIEQLPDEEEDPDDAP